MPAARDSALPARLAGAEILLTGSGALWWPERRLLAVSDLHLGKSGRVARQGGTLWPPYDTADTLDRLSADLGRYDAATVVCLGDSLDDMAVAGEMGGDMLRRLRCMQAGRRWIWIAGNHDPGPSGTGGEHLADLSEPPLLMRHIAMPGASGEVSGHYHPKAVVSGRGHAISRPCFLLDRDRLVLPAYGTYTGGLGTTAPALAALMRADALAVLTGPAPVMIPMPRR